LIINFLNELSVPIKTEDLVQKNWGSGNISFIDLEQVCNKLPKKISSINYYRDTQNLCRAVRVGESEFEIWVPTLFLERAWLIAYLAQQYSDYTVKVVQSPLDRIQIKPFVPPQFRMLFGDRHLCSQEEVNAFVAFFAQPSKKCDARWGRWPSIEEICVVANQFVLAHELGHVALNHFQFQSEVLDRKPFIGGTLGFSEYEFRQGMEVRADIWATDLMANGLLELISRSDYCIETGKQALFALALGITVSICLFDHQKRHLDDEDLSYYPHPLVRLELVAEDIAHKLNASLGASDAVRSAFWRAIVLVNSGLFQAQMQANATGNWLDEDEQFFSSYPLSSLTTDSNIFFNSMLEEIKMKMRMRAFRVDSAICDMEREGAEQLYERFVLAESYWRALQKQCREQQDSVQVKQNALAGLSVEDAFNRSPQNPLSSDRELIKASLASEG
jgi:hypothetical protein